MQNSPLFRLGETSDFSFLKLQKLPFFRLGETTKTSLFLSRRKFLIHSFSYFLIFSFSLLFSHFLISLLSHSFSYRITI